MDDEEIIVLTDNTGEEQEFELVDLIEYEGLDYIVLYPRDEFDDRFHILKVEEDATSEEYDSYVGIDDQALLDRVFKAFLEKHKDEIE